MSPIERRERNDKLVTARGNAQRPPRRRRRLRHLRWLLPIAVYAGLAAYYRYRPHPRGLEPPPRSYRLPAQNLRFVYNMVWYENGERRAVRQVVDTMCELIRRARRWVVLDVFLFNQLHVEHGQFVPVTRQVADAFRGKRHPSYFITDPFNVFYGTMPCRPLDWLREAGVRVGVVDARRIRDNNLVYSPLWRALLQWFGNGRPRWLPNPVDRRYRTTLRAILEALNFKGNHRKVLIADDGNGSYVSFITSGNLEDSGSYYAETGLVIHSREVARHFLASEKAVAHLADMVIPCEVEPGPEPEGEAWLTPLMGTCIKRAVLSDLRAAEAGDELFLFMLFLADRDVLRELKEAALRGVRVSLLLDQSRRSFGSEKRGFPNHFAAAELAPYPNVRIRWGNTRLEEFHTKLCVLAKPDRCIVHLGSANFTRRGLSGTVLEANVRLEAPLTAPVCQDILRYAHWAFSDPRSLERIDLDRSRLKQAWYRLQEITGLATF